MKDNHKKPSIITPQKYYNNFNEDSAYNKTPKHTVKNMKLPQP